MADCPECAGTIEIKEGTELGEILQCPDCGSRLEVRSINPIQLERAPEIQEDWGE